MILNASGSDIKSEHKSTLLKAVNNYKTTACPLTSSVIKVAIDLPIS